MEEDFRPPPIKTTHVITLNVNMRLPKLLDAEAVQTVSQAQVAPGSLLAPFFLFNTAHST